MLLCFLIMNPQPTLYPLYAVVFATVGDNFFESTYSIAIAATVASIRPTGCQESPPHTIYGPRILNQARPMLMYVLLCFPQSL